MQIESDRVTVVLVISNWTDRTMQVNVRVDSLKHFYNCNVIPHHKLSLYDKL
jgi:hypothetical protein